MPKNLLIFSDGTGQAGGIFFDERRSNIYKMYRATRVCPDSSINPQDQVAFYDAGLGTKPASGGGFFANVYRLAYNVVSQATGLGLTGNMVDCYEFIIRFWEPGDRIFLFGFSRGAYTVRCLGGVLGMCGVPTKEPGGPLRRDSANARRLAKRAVKRIYQYTTSWDSSKATPRQRRMLEERKALAERFRQDHGSDAAGKSNAYPYFMGVFDTVASIANKKAVVPLTAVSGVVVVALGGLLSLITGCPWYYVVPGLLIAAVLVAAGFYLTTLVKWAPGIAGGFWKTVHFTQFRQRFDDTDLNENVPYARHALSIDENRADFQRVIWGRRTGKVGPDAHGIEHFEQIWFAGVHSDVGGSYAENESRLSDIALQWMLDAAGRVPDGMKFDGLTLRTFPSADGMQHDEVKRGFGWLTSVFGWNWAVRHRRVPPEAILHQSVYERLALPSVLQHDIMAPYRPSALKEHSEAQKVVGVGCQ